MKSTGVRLTTFLTLFLLAALPGAAWGPTAQTTIVAGAARLMAREHAIPLTNLLDDIRAGAEVSQVELLELLPEAGTDPINAIASEMYLLQAVRTTRVDPYYAYRLGVLGKLTAQVSAPMLDAEATYRTLYLADVERSIGGVVYRHAPRRSVDPRTYFPLVQSQAGARRQLVEKDYQEGVGFRGIASKALSEDVSRSINAVADVWYTILQERVRVVNISKGQMRTYYINALEYYIQNRQVKETEASHARLEALGVQTPDLRKRIADMFYDSRQFERAIEEYEVVLQEQPGRRDVVERIAGYYKEVGDKALRDDRLEEARDAYQSAVAADKLDADAQTSLVEAKRLISDREDRLGEDQAALDQAAALEREAEMQARTGDYGRAMEVLQEAQMLYSGVTTEFPDETRAAQSGLNSVVRRMEELRGEILRNAQRLSGTGSSGDVRALARTKSRELAEEALRKLMRDDYEAYLKELGDTMTRRLEVR